MTVHAPFIAPVAAGLLALLAALAAGRGARLVARGLRRAEPLDLVRGIRVAVIALVAGFCAIGVLAGHAGFAVVGGLILAEELYETATLAAIIRRGEA